MISSKRPAHRISLALPLIAALAGAATAVGITAAETGLGNLAQFRVVADGIPEPIGGIAGDAGRGRTLILGRESANCVLCHALPEPGVRFSGDLGPALGGVARTFSVAQLRLRVVDSMRVNPTTIMPSYYRIEGLDRVAGAYRGKPILAAEQVEDIVAYLATLKNE
jgi:L-cysteine S-thiosulfotransferase